MFVFFFSLWWFSSTHLHPVSLWLVSLESEMWRKIHVGFGTGPFPPAIGSRSGSFTSLGLWKNGNEPLQWDGQENQTRNWEAITSTVLVCSRCSVSLLLSLLAYRLLHQHYFFMCDCGRFSCLSPQMTTFCPAPSSQGQLPLRHMIPR